MWRLSLTRYGDVLPESFSKAREEDYVMAKQAGSPHWRRRVCQEGQVLPECDRWLLSKGEGRQHNGQKKMRGGRKGAVTHPFADTQSEWEAG